MRYNISGVISSNAVETDAHKNVHKWFDELGKYIAEKKKTNAFYIPHVTSKTFAKHLVLMLVSIFGLCFFIYLSRQHYSYSTVNTANNIFMLLGILEAYSGFGRLAFLMLLIRSIYMMFVTNYSLNYDRRGVDTSKKLKAADERIDRDVVLYENMVRSCDGMSGSSDASDYIINLHNSTEALYDKSRRTKKTIAIILVIASVLFMTLFQWRFLFQTPPDNYPMAVSSYFVFSPYTMFRITFFWVSLIFTALVFSVTEGYVMLLIPTDQKSKRNLTKALFLIPAFVYSYIVQYYFSVAVHPIDSKIPEKYLCWLILAAVFVAFLLIDLCSDFEREKRVYSIGGYEIIKVKDAIPRHVKVTKGIIWRNIIIRSLLCYFLLIITGEIVSTASSTSGIVVWFIVFSIISLIILPAFKGKDTSSLECMLGRGKCIAITLIYFIIAFSEILYIQTVIMQSVGQTAFPITETFACIFGVANLIVDSIQSNNTSGSGDAGTKPAA